MEGLYLNPPDHALVLCLDEKSQIQALDRTQPGLPVLRLLTPLKMAYAVAKKRAEPYTKIVEEPPQMRRETGATRAAGRQRRPSRVCPSQ